MTCGKQSYTMHAKPCHDSRELNLYIYGHMWVYRVKELLLWESEIIMIKYGSNHAILRLKIMWHNILRDYISIIIHVHDYII